MKIQYQITRNYVSNWSLAHAIREVMANAFDAEKQLGAKAQIKYDKKNKRLTVRNENVSVRHEDALYFGESSKRGQDFIGQYGEGLKLALLVFARLDLDVVIKNGANENWRPSMQTDKLGVECLTLDITKADRQEGHFDVVLNGIEEESWDTIRSWFLQLSPASEVKQTTYGQLLDDPEYVGKIFVRGVYVTTRPKYDFGYNFFHVDTGRDRQVPSNFDIDWSIQQIWNELSKKGDAKFRARLFKSFESEAAEQEAFLYNQPPALVTAMVTEFKENYGDKAVPVAGTGEGGDLEHLGHTPVPLPKRLVALLRAEMPSPEKIKAEYSQQVVKRYRLAELSPVEVKNFTRALELLFPHVRDATTRAVIVDFGSKDVLGLHSGEDVYIAKEVAQDFGKLAMVLVHEFAHDSGADGSKAHTDAIQSLSEALVNQLWRQIPA
jgi:hypothetical protein